MQSTTISSQHGRTRNAPDSDRHQPFDSDLCGRARLPTDHLRGNDRFFCSVVDEQDLQQIAKCI